MHGQDHHYLAKHGVEMVIDKSGNQRRAQFLSRPMALEPNFKVGQLAPEYRLNANDLRQAVTKEEQLDDREELRST